MSSEASFITSSQVETEALGEALVRLLPLGSVVALRGDLASGKTCLVRGMARRFIDGPVVHSPTFTLVNEYGGREKLYHLDLYRLSAEEVADLGYEELFEPESAITAVEWAERADRLLPSRVVNVHLEHLGQDRRSIRIEDPFDILPPGWPTLLPHSA